MRGRSTSPEGRAVLHQAADESFVCGQELRCAKEGLLNNKLKGHALADILTKFGEKLPKDNAER